MAGDAPIHRYETRVAWTGSTGVGYDDDAQAVMPDDDPPVRITAITRRPRVVVTTGPTESRVHHLLEVAHRECFIANSLRSEITLESQVSFVAP